MMKTAGTLLLCILLCPASLASRDTTLYFASPHFPPWNINDPEQAPSGVNAQIAKAIAKTMGLKYEALICPWKRCLALMEKGTLDLAGSVGKNPERSKYLLFAPSHILIPDRVIYLSRKLKYDILQYTDLYKLNSIGVERGARVFTQFDDDQRLIKKDAPELAQLFNMLLYKRIDAVVGNEVVMDYVLQSQNMKGLFKKASYRYQSNDMQFFALSKNSPHAHKIDQVKHTLDQLAKDGTLKKLVKSYTQ